MKRLVLSLALASSLVPAAAFACDDSHQASAAEPKKATVADVAAWTKAKQATPVDANGKETRSSQGVIPGAILLTSSSEFAAAELPANKDAKLVFYCANEKCTASDSAAKRAMGLGYTDVAVLPAGITGWKKAGQSTAKANNT